MMFLVTDIKCAIKTCTINIYRKYYFVILHVSHKRLKDHKRGTNIRLIAEDFKKVLHRT